MSEVAKRSQSCLPECMAPDGAEPCRGYSHLYLSALNVEQNLNNRIGQLEQQLADALGEVERLERRVEDLSTPLAAVNIELEAQLEASEAENAKLESLNAALDIKYNSAAQSLEQVDAENAKLREAVQKGWEDSFNNWVIPSEFVFSILPELGDEE